MENYIKEILFQEIEIEQLTITDLEKMKTKEGIIIPSRSSTDLWIHRELSVEDVLHSKVVMESANNYEIRDSFGMRIWVGDSKSVIAYVKGFFEGNI